MSSSSSNDLNPNASRNSNINTSIRESDGSGLISQAILDAFASKVGALEERISGLEREKIAMSVLIQAMYPDWSVMDDMKNVARAVAQTQIVLTALRTGVTATASTVLHVDGKYHFVLIGSDKETEEGALELLRSVVSTAGNSDGSVATLPHRSA